MELHEVLAVVPCVKCGCLGELDNSNRLPKSRHTRTCDYCLGKRFVSLNTCRGCGRPGGVRNGPITFCGRKECWERLVDMVVPEEPSKKVVTFLPIVDKRRFRMGPSPYEYNVDRAHRLGMTYDQFMRHCEERE